MSASLSRTQIVSKTVIETEAGIVAAHVQSGTERGPAAHSTIFQ